MQNSALGTEFLILLLLIIVVAIVIYFYMKYRGSSTKTTDHYLKALESLADGDLKMAVQKFKEAVKDDTDNIQAYLRLGNLLRERGMIKNALKIHRDLTHRENLNPAIKTQIDKSLMIDYELAGDFENAAAIARKIVDTNGDTKAVEKLISYLEKEKQWEAAFETLKPNLKKMDPSFKSKAALYLVFIGLDLIQEERGKDGRIKFKEALKLDADCTSAFYYLGHSYYLENRVEEAIEHWKKLAINDIKKGYIVYKDLERSWFDLGKFSESEKLYRQILSKDRENIHAIYALCEIYNKKGEYDAAMDILNETEIEHIDLQLLKSKIFLNKGQYKNAANQAIEMLEKNPQRLQHTFKCNVCNASVKEMRWFCSECKNINTFV